MTRAGARYDAGTGRCAFRVWAPLPRTVELKITAPAGRVVAMERAGRGWWSASVDGLGPGGRYFYRLDGERDRPDPVSDFQPEGVHGPSEVVDHDAFRWEDGA